MAPARNFGLDAWRCIAIAVVLANHAFLTFFLEPGLARWGGVAAFASTASVLSIEWLFALSGFLIGTMMIRVFEREGTWWRRARSFWLRRWFRTLPNYYLFLLVNIVLLALGIVDGAYSPSFAWFGQNLAGPMGDPPFFPESWTLALDEWFYVLLPILIGLWLLAFGGRSSNRHAFVLAASTLIALPTLARWLTEPAADALDWTVRIRPVTLYHLDTTGWGVVAAIVSRWHPRLWARLARFGALPGAALTLVGLAMLEAYTFAPAWSDGSRTWTALPLTLTGLGGALALPWVTTWRPVAAAVETASARLSDWSYSIYLSHLPLAFLLRAGMAPSEAASPAWLAAHIVAWVVLTIALSACIHVAFEKPVTDLRERWTRKVDASPFANPATPP